MAKNPESPLEPFKRALVNATRSLAESPDLEIVYSGEGPQLSGNRAVLPHPPRDLTEIDAARIRGFADQMALRIAHHDAAAQPPLSRHRLPEGPRAADGREAAGHGAAAGRPLPRRHRGQGRRRPRPAE